MYILIECDIGGGWGVDIVECEDIDQLKDRLTNNWKCFNNTLDEMLEWAKNSSPGSMVEVIGDGEGFVHIVNGTEFVRIMSEEATKRREGVYYG